MSDDFRITGAEDFLALSKALKHAGRGELRKELNKQMRDAAKPLIGDVRQAAERELPKHGGLNRVVSRGRIRVQTRTGAQTAGVRIVGAGQGLRSADLGILRHPVFGHRDRFVAQDVPAGWFTATLNDKARTVLPALAQAVQNIADQVVREAKRG
ncbi:MAG: hypothetical protein ACXV5Q_00675 [Frankiaceae bacterium]